MQALFTARISVSRTIHRQSQINLQIVLDPSKGSVVHSLIDIPSVHRCLVSLGYRLGNVSQPDPSIHPEKKWWSSRKKTIRDLRVGYRQMNKIASSDAATASISDPYLARFPSFQPLPFQYSAYFSLLTQPCRGRDASPRPGYYALFPYVSSAR